MEKLPLAIKRLGPNGIRIQCKDRSICDVSSEVLRSNCPCAICEKQRLQSIDKQGLQNKKNSLKIISSSIDEENFLEEIQPVGNYAVKLKWKDGHNTGIYSFTTLARLSHSS